MNQDLPGFAWFDDAIVPFHEAKLHVLSAAVRYGSTVFEGYCIYRSPTAGELSLFRAEEHHRRLRASAHLMRMAVDLPSERLNEIVRAVVKANGFDGDMHVRLSVHLVGDYLSSFGSEGPVVLSCVAIPRGEKPPKSRLTKAQISSWRRIGDEFMPPRIKAAANYQNSRLGIMQAKNDGYQEVIFLDSAGKVSEASASTLFMLRDGAWSTPATTSGILESITRDSLIRILRDSGETVHERTIDRTELYLADEVFLCGSAAEVTPIGMIDGFTVGVGGCGSRTQALWERFNAVARGAEPAPSDWRTETL